MATYVISDLHGQYGILKFVLKNINFGKDDFLWVLGDCIDRGPDGIKILQYIKSHKNMDMLLGNHEYMMLNSVDSSGYKKIKGRDASLWLWYNGGSSTAGEFFKKPVETRRSLLKWLRSRKLITTVAVGDLKYTLTHSYYIKQWVNKPFDYIPDSQADKIVWYSPYRHDYMTRCEKFYYNNPEEIFIVGHVPIPSIKLQKSLEPFIDNNCIFIDGGLTHLEKSDHIGAVVLRLEDQWSFCYTTRYIAKKMRQAVTTDKHKLLFEDLVHLYGETV